MAVSSSRAGVRVDVCLYWRSCRRSCRRSAFIASFFSFGSPQPVVKKCASRLVSAVVSSRALQCGSSPIPNTYPAPRGRQLMPHPFPPHASRSQTRPAPTPHNATQPHPFFTSIYPSLGATHSTSAPTFGPAVHSDGGRPMTTPRGGRNVGKARGNQTEGQGQRIRTIGEYGFGFRSYTASCLTAAWHRQCKI